jgi:hypothetical protein
MGSPINYSAPKNPAQPIAQSNGRVNPYLTNSNYENMQLHTPSGLYYNNGKVYESYTPAPVNVISSIVNSLANGPFGFNTSSGYGPNSNSPFGSRNVSSSTTGGPVEGSISSGDQWFKPYTGNAPGIINGDISMVYGLNSQPSSYTPQPMENLFPGLNSSLTQTTTSPSSLLGAGKYLSNTNSPINYSASKGNA